MLLLIRRSVQPFIFFVYISYQKNVNCSQFCEFKIDDLNVGGEQCTNQLGNICKKQEKNQKNPVLLSYFLMELGEKG